MMDDESSEFRITAMDRVKRTVSKAGAKVKEGVKVGAGKVTETTTSAVKHTTKGVSGGATLVRKGTVNLSKGALTVTKMGVSKVTDRASAIGRRGSSRVFNPEDMGPIPSDERLLLALMERRVQAQVKDLDCHRKADLISFETEYIIRVQSFDPITGHPELGFVLKKPYSAFRTLAEQLYQEAKDVMYSSANLPKRVISLAKYCHTAFKLVESQKQDFLGNLGKVNFKHVQAQAKQRSEVINRFLATTTANFPEATLVNDSRQPFGRIAASLIEQFFLTDHFEEEDEEEEEADGEDTSHNPTIEESQSNGDYDESHTSYSKTERSHSESLRMSSYSQPERRSIEAQLKEENQKRNSRLSVESLLKEEKHYLQEETNNPQPEHSQKESIWVTGATIVDEKPVMALVLFGGAMQVLRMMDPPELGLDVALFLCFGTFCLGVHALRLLGMPPARDKED